MELLRSTLERRRGWYSHHIIIESEENSIDPDDGNSWICSACTLPIFSTPFQRIKENVKLLLHDQCVSLPEKLMDHSFHPRRALHLVKNEDSSSSTISCDKCSEKCGSMFYKCKKYYCDLRLDLLCSLPMIKIMHRSHQHRLMVIRGSASFICGACGTQHQGISARSYLCSDCDFWIHRDCAALPNAIKLLHPEHQHSLFLTYDRSSISSASSSSSKCGICGDVLESLGMYLCVKCGYYVHIRCATFDPQCFEPVLIREAKLVDLLHLPMADERANIVQYMLENTSSVDDEAEVEAKKKQQQKNKKRDDDGCRHDPKLKKHSLIFHDQDDDVSDDDDDDDDVTGYSSRVCNACVQFISPPFYSCSKCRDFLLHSCCADLPRKIHHPIHPAHTLFLFSETPKLLGLQNPGFLCHGCERLCSGFGYSCETCPDFKLDVVCALMPLSITHESHGKTHILHMSRETDSEYPCSCCMLDLDGIFYECSNCRQLKLHAHCALLPTTISHTFDRHPLKLTTSPKISVITTDDDDNDEEEEEEEEEEKEEEEDDDDEEEEEKEEEDDDDDDDEEEEEEEDEEGEEMQHICDVCEENIWKWEWYYSCKQRDSWFHINCIPFFNRLFKVKYGVSVDVKFHDCPLTLVPEATLSGYHCHVCRLKFKYMCTGGGLRMDCAYECTKCNYRVHGKCAVRSSKKKQRS